MHPTPASVKVEKPRTFRQRSAAYLTLLTFASAVFLLDRLSKVWITHALPYNPYHDHGHGIDFEVIPGFFFLIHIGNTGAAWSMFSGRTTLLAVFAVLTLGAFFRWRHQLGLKQRVPQIAFGLLCGGILGNLVDRLLYRHVIDFIDLHFGSYIYPTFNIADSAILIGAVVYIWMTWRQTATTERR